MSFNQSKGEKSESQYRKPGRSVNSGNNPRTSSGAAGGKGGGSNAPPPQPSLATNRSFNKKPGSGGGQSRVGVPNSNSQFNTSATRPSQNGGHFQSPASGFSEAPAPVGAVKPTNPPAPRSTRPVPKAPSSQIAPGGFDSVAPSTPSKDRTSGGPRPDRRDDDKWNKSPGSFVPGRDPRLEGAHGGSAVGSRPGQGGNHGVLRNPRGQEVGQHVGGILSGAAHPLGSQGGMQWSNSDADRWQRTTGYHKGLIPSPQTPLQVMHKADKKYEIRKVSDIEEAKQRQLKAILNKLMPQNFDKLFMQVKEVNIDNAVTLTGVVSQTFDKALMEPTFCEMYANFCSHLAAELPDFSEDNEKITFKRLLLNKCQEEFERGEREQAEANRVEEEGEIKCSEEEREEKRIQARRRMLGNIRLIGELYKKKMLPEKILHHCIQELLEPNKTPDEEDIESLCELMSTIGVMLDRPKRRQRMDTYFNIMTKLSNNMELSSRVRFMLKDTIDLRNNKWQQRNRDLRASDRSLDRSMPSSSAPVQATSIAHPQTSPEKVLPEEQLRDMSISTIREFYRKRRS